MTDNGADPVGGCTKLCSEGPACMRVAVKGVTKGLRDSTR